MSEEALSRAMSLLRAVWDESGTGTDIIARKANHGNHWNDVLRWVNDVDWREMEETNRWDGFSDEELEELCIGVVQRRDGSKAVPAEYRERAGRLATELRKVLVQREAEQPTYRGPGRYRHTDGSTYDVLGAADDGFNGPMVVIMRHSSGSYYYEYKGDFEKLVNGQRRYEYLGPLEDNATAPTPAQVERASQAMAQLSQGMITEAKVYAFDIGDRAVVRTILNAALSS